MLAPDGALRDGAREVQRDLVRPIRLKCPAVFFQMLPNRVESLSGRFD